MLHNAKNLPRRQTHLLKRTKRENMFNISPICLKCQTPGTVVPVDLRGFTSDTKEVQKPPTSFTSSAVSSERKFSFLLALEG